MRSDLEERCRALLTELGLTTPDSKITAHGLLGGVSSDIAVVTTEDRRVCAKFALPTLKVEADWFAPVHRNAAEFAWLEFAAEVAPDSAVKLYGRSEALHGFAMEYLEGKEIYLWKSALLEQARPEGEIALGEQLSVFIQPEGGKGMAFTPTVVKVEPNRELRWLGNLGIRGMFDGEHIFTIEPDGEDSVVYVHREELSGLLIPLVMPFIEEDTLRGFNDMNVALKDRVEQSETE